MKHFSNVRPFALVVALPFLAFVAPADANAQEESQYSNLRVLPENISRRELNRIMLANQIGLGLPRRQNEGCLYCHEGDMEIPVGEWDFASDAKPEKIRARAMLQMVADINGRHLAGIEDRVAPDLEVTCYTCHAGRTDPRELPEILWAAYDTGGIEQLVSEYQSLRDRYYGADAYDFRPHVLDGISTELADRDSFSDALTLARLNSEVHPTVPDARANWLRIKLEQTESERGVEAALTEFATFKATEPSDVVSYGLLDWMGWRLWLKDRKDVATRIFETNLSEFPNDYLPHESMASVLRASGDWDGAFGLYEDWLGRNPDHAMARRQLTNLRARHARQSN